MHGFHTLLGVAAVDGAALVNNAAETSLLNGASKIALLKNFFDRTSKTIIVRASGRISTLAAAPGTLTFRAKFGAIAVFNGGAMALNVNAQVNASWELYLELTLRALGDTANANVIGTGVWTSRAIIGGPAAGVGGTESLMLPDTAPAVGTGFDSTAEQALDLTAQWSVANAANSIQLHQCRFSTFD